MVAFAVTVANMNHHALAVNFGVEMARLPQVGRTGNTAAGNFSCCFPKENMASFMLVTKIKGS